MQNYIVFGSIVINILPDFVNNLVSFVYFHWAQWNSQCILGLLFPWRIHAFSPSRMVKRRNLLPHISANKNLPEPDPSRWVSKDFETEVDVWLLIDNLCSIYAFVSMSMMIYSVVHRVLVNILNLCVGKKVPVPFVPSSTTCESTFESRAGLQTPHKNEFSRSKKARKRVWVLNLWA